MYYITNHVLYPHSRISFSHKKKWRPEPSYVWMECILLGVCWNSSMCRPMQFLKIKSGHFWQIYLQTFSHHFLSVLSHLCLCSHTWWWWWCLTGLWGSIFLDSFLFIFFWLKNLMWPVLKVCWFSFVPAQICCWSSFNFSFWLFYILTLKFIFCSF